MATRWCVAKDEAVADHGMVAAKHPLAVEAGLAALKRGGNAVDAAVTTAFTLAVVEPGASGLGGGGMMVVHQAATGRNVVVDFAMDAPLVAAADTYELESGIGPSRFGWRKVKDDANVSGYRAAAVPGLVRGLALALEWFGTVSLSEALGPAIRFAEEGFVPAWTTSLQIAVSMPILSRFSASAAVFLPGGFPPRPADGNNPGDRLGQPDLARTLRAIARTARMRSTAGRSLGRSARRCGNMGAWCQRRIWRLTKPRLSTEDWRQTTAAIRSWACPALAAP